jgi:hypothetical protein
MKSHKKVIDSIIVGFRKKGSKEVPIAKAIDLARSHPDAIKEYAIAMVERLPEGGSFLDDAVSYLPQEDWAELSRVALRSCETSSGRNKAAEAIIACASLQAPTVLHAELDRIFTIRPNAGAYYESYPWRESGAQHFEFLRKRLEDEASSVEDRQRAWRAMLETRNLDVVKHALSLIDQVEFDTLYTTRKQWEKIYLNRVGFDRKNRKLRRTCSDTLYHLQFSDSFFGAQDRPAWLARTHPTWKLPPSTGLLSFGGTTAGKCSCCGGQLHRLLLLEPVPQGIGVTGLKHVDLATCLSCLGWEQETLFYRHRKNGTPMSVVYEGPRNEPQFPVGPLKSGKVRLAATPQRWHWQNWGDGQNLNRIGGEPSWVQDADYPNCPSCKGTMSYLLQLDSNLPAAGGHEWLWGSGGMAYGFWCDACTISAFLWQCT